MNKIYSLFIAAVFASAGTAMAQQLPNGIGNFDATWEDCYPNMGNKKSGIEPAGWGASNVYQVMAFSGLVTQGEDRTNPSDASHSVVLTNTYCGMMGMGSNAPAYMSLGDAWNYGDSKNLGKPEDKSDGGSYGGADFTYRPDAVSMWLKRTHKTELESGEDGALNAEEKATVLVYAWKGQTTSTVRIGLEMDWIGNAKDVTMTNRDKDVLGMTTDGVTKSEDFALISKSENYIEGDLADWTQMVFDIEYVNTDLAPEKLNIVISSSDYFTRPNIGVGNTLNVDDVTLVYYSTLNSLTIGGNAVELEDGVYDYETDFVMPTSVDEVVALTKGKFANAQVELKPETKTVSITVSNQGGADLDGMTEHTYNIVCNGVESVNYDGYLNVEMEGSKIVMNQAATVSIAETGAGLCTFTLPNFSISAGGSQLPLGDIVVENVAVTSTADGKSYEGVAEDMQFLNGLIVADVKISGTISAAGVADFVIDVVWDNEGTDVPINVTFTTEPVWVSESYDGYLNVEMKGSQVVSNQAATVNITETGEGLCTFTLPNFSISMGDSQLPLGDIVVENVAVTSTADGKSYEGVAEGMQFLEGLIVADVKISGTISAAGVADFVIDVVWDNEGTDVPINVTFTTEPVWASESYDGYLNVEMRGSQVVSNQAATVNITETGEGLCTFTLPNFSISMGDSQLPLGDIVVENVAVTSTADGKSYEGEAEGMQFLDGLIVADVKISGTISAAGVVDFVIDVVWDNEGTDVPINVTFTSNEVAGLDGISDSNVAVFGSNGSIVVNGYTGAMQVYGMTGQLVKAATVDGNAVVEMPAGVYVVRLNGAAVKVVVK